MNKLRRYLLKLLAGKDIVVINATICGEITVFWNETAYIENTTVYPALTSIAGEHNSDGK